MLPTPSYRADGNVSMNLAELNVYMIQKVGSGLCYLLLLSDFASAWNIEEQ